MPKRKLLTDEERYCREMLRFQSEYLEAQDMLLKLTCDKTNGLNAEARKKIRDYLLPPMKFMGKPNDNLIKVFDEVPVDG